MKTSKRIISFVLCALMVASCFFCTGKLPELEAKAASVGSFSQTRVVSNYESLYRSYQKRFFGGEETNWPTDFVIPGLSSSEDYTPQGMTYWAEKEWILISAYDASGSGKNSVIYALDVVTTNLVAVFKIQNADGTTNTSHGGGIAASKYNFYYADSASKVSYIPLSEMDISGGEKTIKLRDSVDFAKEMTGADTGETVKTSYCCYDDGILWTGNFHWYNDSKYSASYHAEYPSILLGYKLAGNSSEKEWYYLKNGYNLAKITNSNATTEPITKNSSDGTYSATMTYKKIEIDGAHLEVRGTVEGNTTSASQSASDTRIGEITTPSNIGSFDLVEGTQYKISFVSTNPDTDIYMWSPGGKHCNVKQAQSSSKRQLDDGRWYYEMIFTAGLKPTGADSLWPTTQSTDGSYTGTYNFRIDQDNILGSFDFAVTDISVCEYNGASFDDINPDYEGVGCAGNPTYVVAINTDRIQYAMVDKGKLYVSRSWSRNESGNHTRELMIADIDLNRPGDIQYPVNGRDHNIYLINNSDSSVTHFGGNYSNSNTNDFGYDASAEELDKMLWMGEALCVIDDYLYMFGEGAAWDYNGKDSSSICGEPIDVIWKIDQYAIQGLTRPHDDVAAVEYEKVDKLSELKSSDEYIVLHTSPIKDPVTQDNILYLLDSFGGYGDKKLPKKAAAANVTDTSTGDSRGIVGYEIRDYSIKIDRDTGKESLILSAEDDANKSLHWQFDIGTVTESGSEKTASVNIKNRDLYYAKHPYLYGGDTLYAMTSTPSSMSLKSWENGDFSVIGNGYSLWCNDGSVPASITGYTNFYGDHEKTGYVPNYHGLAEVAGTFHATNVNHNYIAQSSDAQQIFQIYKRVSDPYASSYETQVYTDLQAELTSDGTYNITLETYATNNLQYQQVDERPTDFIFVLDTSGSMLDDQDCAGYIRYGETNTLSAYSVAGNSKSVGDTGAVTGATGNIYYMADDGVYHQLFVDASERKGSIFSYYKYFWLYYKSNGVNVYYNPSTKGWQTTKPSESEVGKSSGNSDEARAKCTIYTGVHYEKSSSLNRLQAVQNAVESLTYKIAAEAAASGLDHRIALTSFGSDGSLDSNYLWTGTGMYTNSGTWVSYPNITTANYQNAFFSVSQFGTARNVVYNMQPLGHTYPSYGLDMASKIVDNSAYKYDVNGERSAVVIVISDGVPGGDTDNFRTTPDLTISVANSTLAGGAYSLKRNGAYIYTALLGTDTHYSESAFDERDFMKYLSSEYTGSKSMTDPGPYNTRESINYFYHVPGGTAFNLDAVTDKIFNEVVVNSTNATASLTADAILREHLTDAFDLTNASIKYETAKSKYDGIGRLYFEAPVEATGFNTSFDKVNNNIEVKGFDYSANNVSEYNSDKGLGKKLIVTISGVIADRNSEIELDNTSINDTTLTALYENDTYMSSNQPVKKFPTYHFSIPEYTYVLDYDLPMLDTDINGTLISVDTDPDKQSTYVTNLQTDVLGVEFVDNAQNMLYSLNSQEGSTERNSRAYVLIRRDNGDYDWFRLNIIPASNVYFEDNKTKTLAGTESYVGWTQFGSYEGKEQTAVREGDVFGNDPLYSSSENTFSLGTNKSVTVTSSAKRSNTQTFTFKGTGFDLVSACGPNTGIQTVVIRDANGELVQTYIVDTYFNDTNYGTIYQAPIVHFEEGPEDANSDGSRNEYTVEVTAAYYSFAGALKPQSVDVQALGETGIDAYTATAETSVTDEFFAEIGMDELIGQEVELVWMDEDSVLNGGMGATETTVSTQSGESSSTTTPATSLINYIDGFRIYNPLTATEANKNYPANEKNATYYNLINNLGSGTMTGSSLFAYIEGNAGTYDFSEYSGLKGKGPKNEVYLNSNASNGIAFNLSVTGNVSAKLSMRAASGSPVVKINDKTFTVTNTSEQYFDITEAVKDKSTVTISVTSRDSKDLVAIGNLRLNNASVAALASDDLPNVARMMTMAATPVTYDPLKVYTPAPTFVDAPADDPNIDPEGRIPTLEEYIAIHGSGNNGGDDHSGADSFADKLIAIVEKVIDFIKKVIALVANTVTNIF